MWGRRNCETEMRIQDTRCYMSSASVRCFRSSHAAASSVLHCSSLDSTTLDFEHAVLVSPRSYIARQHWKSCLISFWQSISWKLRFERQVLSSGISSDRAVTARGED